jgi:hypothetical protein
MLTQNATPLRAAPGGTLLLQGEGVLFNALADNLPGGWKVNIQADANMAWIAFVHRADTPQGRPLFIVCRWTDCVGLFVQWGDGSAPSFVTCTELRPILDTIPRSIFTFAAGSLATVSMAGWADTLH